MTITNARDQLGDVERRVSDLRDRVAAARAEHEQTRQAVITADAAPGTATFAAAERAVARLRAAERDLNLTTQEHVAILKSISGTDGNVFDQHDNFLRDPAVLGSLGAMATSSAPVGRQRLGS
ncbi:hypothetical protein [Capillimicrobium parvum]|uniref:Uncharacterized protein n=1 Tax=Capillimicrobium parvum TaxID=2884022 RepID=A0A9E7C2F9_9ACTN|nr:hypothetical protein [Capillimicrobium parvum]UGS38401.1 hypothetical protein DSM104329_04827 [Capillimicrobium parvum]